MTKVLVTGGSGFIGGHLIPKLVQEGYQVLNVDLRDGRDIREASACTAIINFQPELTFHLAAYHYVPWCRTFPRETINNNVLGTDLLLQTLGLFGCENVVIASSAAVYGFGPDPFREDATPAPVDVYGFSKLTCEELLARHMDRWPDVKGASARLFNVIGIGDHNDHVLPRILAGASHLGNRHPLRDYVWVEDVVDALLALAGRKGVYNVGTGVPTSVEDLVELAGRKVTFGHLRRNLDGDLVSDPRRMKALGWKPRDTESVVKELSACR